MPEWYFQNTDGSRVGPLTDDDFHTRLAAGEVCDGTRVWRSGLADWTNYAAIRAHDTHGTTAITSATTVAAQVPKVEDPSRAPCGICGDEWPRHLLQGTPEKPICGNCLRKSAGDEWRRKLRDADGVGGGWGSWLLRCVLMAVVVGGLLCLKSCLKQEARKVRRQPPTLLDPRVRP